MVPVQFITHFTPTISYLDGALMALEGGCKWIQLRMKGAPDEEVEDVARKLKEDCKARGAVFVIDDRVELVKKLEVDGVHLGKEDMPVDEARKVLGEAFLIGGTANTIEDVRALRRAGADYIGLGPYRTTTTKEKLAPVLGLEGYRRILAAMQTEEIPLPVCAIGGIETEDVAEILRTGVRGVAVSGAVLRAEQPVEMMRRFLSADNAFS